MNTPDTDFRPDATASDEKHLANYPDNRPEAVLDRILEEEKKEFESAFMNNGVNGILGDEFQESKMLLMRTHFTTAMQRAYEAGREDQKKDTIN